MKLSELIDREVVIQIKKLGKAITATIRGVEFGGIWIESQSFTNETLAHYGVPSTPNTPVFFFPYSEVEVVISAIPLMGLNETEFDV